MTDFLVISGISLKTIEQLKRIPSIPYDLNCNKEECVKIITLLKLLGIKKIDDLILNKTRLFLKTKDEILDLFSKKDTNKLVELINDDIDNIDMLFE